MTYSSYIKKLKAHRWELVDAGLNPATVNSYIYGKRTPDINKATIIAKVLGLSLSQIPYRQVIVNKPK